MAATALPVYVLYNVDNVVVGHTFGTVALAYYARAYFLMTLPTLLATNSLREVMVPSLAAFQGDSKRMGDAYRRAVQLIAFVGFPLTAGLAVAAPEAVRLVYGPRWNPVAPIVVLLAIGGIAFPVMETARWLFIAAGRAREMFLWSSASAVALAASAFVGARWGLHGVAVSCAVCIACVVTIPMLAAAHRAVGLPLCPTLAPLGSLLLTTGLMTAASAGAGLLATTHHLPWPLVLTAKVITGVLCYGVLTALFHRPLPLAPAERLLQFLLRQPVAGST
jgi:PST family polysaccharide transporter